MRRWFLYCLVFSSGVSSSLPAHAFIEAPSAFVIDHDLQKVDSIAPPAPVIRVKAVSRGFGRIYFSNGTSGYVTDTGGSVFVDILPEGQEIEEVGYCFHLVDGTMPKALNALPTGAWSALGPPRRNYIPFYWYEGDTWWHEPFSFRLYLTATDRAGNESQPSNTVIIASDGNMETTFENQPGPIEPVTDLQGTWTGKDEHGVKTKLAVSARRFRITSGGDAYEGFVQVWQKDDKQRQIVVDGGAELKFTGPYEVKGDRLSLSLTVPGTSKHYDLRRNTR